MASWMSGSSNPVYGMRDSLDLQTKITEAKVLGPEGVRSDLVQKLSLSALPAEDQLSVLRQSPADRANAKGKSGFAALNPAASSKNIAAPVQFANVYRNTAGFAAVA